MGRPAKGCRSLVRPAWRTSRHPVDELLPIGEAEMTKGIFHLGGVTPEGGPCGLSYLAAFGPGEFGTVAVVLRGDLIIGLPHR